MRNAGMNGNFVSSQPVVPASTVIVDLAKRKPKFAGAARNGANMVQIPEEKDREYRLNFLDRSENSTKGESGKVSTFEFSDVTEPTGITTWQVVDGGIRYLTGDGKLHTLVVRK